MDNQPARHPDAQPPEAEPAPPPPPAAPLTRSALYPEIPWERWRQESQDLAESGRQPGAYTPAPPPEAAAPWSHGHYQEQRPGRPSRAAGGAGAAVGIGALLLKLLSAAKFATLGLFKFKLALSLVINIGLYAVLFGSRMGLLFGIAFATGFVALILVHETGHLIAARMEGVKVTAPFFIPFMGAAIVLQQNPRDARSEAIIGIGGPITGTLGALAVYAMALTVGPETQLGQFFAVLASYGFFINLFNMIPMSPLDGGRILGAVSKWFNVLGLAVIVLAMVSGVFASPILILVLIFGAFGVYRRFTQPEHPGYYDISPGAKAVIGLSYLFLLAVLISGLVAVGSLATAQNL